jgi:hypothetical protein
MNRPHNLSLVLVLATLLSVVFVGLNANVAHAGLVSCRSDPLVVLSDGTVIDVSAEVDTLLWNVTEVHYTLHIPQGLKPILIVHTPAWLTSQETFSIYADNPPDEYESTTTVRTRNGQRGVIAHMLVNVGYGNASGFTGEELSIRLRTQ